MPEGYDVIVIGGGPAGATASGLLAKWGRRVLVLEKEKFPRYHIGESLVPGCVPVIEELGATELVEAAGATKKYGISLIWGAVATPWSVDFDEVSPHPYAYQVKRAEFDNLLLTHSRRLGATVVEEATVRGLVYDGDRCVGVRYGAGRSEELTEVRAPYVIDASGQGKLLARQLDAVGWHEDLRNLAVWTYFQGGDRLDGRRAGNILVENCPPGWLWLIPFSDDTCSVGFVAQTAEVAATGLAPAEVLRRQIGESNEVRRLLADAVEVAQPRTAKDWSYTCGRMSVPGCVAAGDAAAFIDPLFSTGVMLAMKGASSAARTVNAILDEPGRDDELRADYEKAYRDFLDVVVSFVRFFYDPEKKIVEYFEQAQDLVDPYRALAAREDFIMLISGLYGARPVMESTAPDPLAGTAATA
ncbi:NAD(P)/FAD-dependent oxidoreductase [Solihabitans fulvus]|uniref:NAD(P)/FAD-dependent oxidoreductase n=1 Tax=Solihabitans fulvus TaxID=1892852 RepID=A0A5B2WLQ6_9PSEU|nr:NAD(P)/FAD-dependent oxidoreductase [Solihabitans fulvus]KAA2251399.1 NAD(P)/FAD-dependent oxidoreductase [Solihabitans fulvus]